MPEYFIGIDASLNTLDLCVLNTEEKIISQKRFLQTKEEFNKLTEFLQTLGNPQNLAIGIESIGSYHINILHFLLNKTYHITLLLEIPSARIARELTPSFNNPGNSKVNSESPNEATAICAASSGT
ncbi:MAG TPA: hypothetical protein ENI34_09690 [candidate division WOR-3 bacterium]|uniref:Transposase IS110-like N-terminal domain-containing protein n=1 Tax=candidate division WOR-3 bacterium TaxID=2052148 RepID=A0A9C9K184_UNCW3|nr:hypothetical protein [candidate division WOR-3 bacterium]